MRRVEDACRTGDLSVDLQVQLLATMDLAVVVVDLDGLVLYWNAAAEQMFGWTAAEALGRPVAELVLPPDLLAAARASRASLVDGVPYAGDWEVRHRSGRRFVNHVVSFPLRDPDGRTVALAALANDVTAVRHAHYEAVTSADAIAARERSWRARFDDVAVPQAVTDLEGRVLAVNDALCRLVGYPREELLGRWSHQFHHPADRQAGRLRMREALDSDRGSAQWERIFARADGSPVPVLVTTSLLRDDEGEPESLAVFIQDLSVLREAEQRTREYERQLSSARADALQERERLLHHDQLTGLPNRSALERRLAEAGGGTAGGQLAALFVALDDFRLVNESHGHHVGDEVLRAVARSLGALARPGDTLARWGGDVFVLLRPDVDRCSCERAAEQALAALGAPIIVGGVELRVTASIGIAVSPPAAIDELLRGADAAVHEAKRRGRGQVEVLDPETPARAAAQLRLLHDLRAALEGDELELQYQPLVELASEQVTGVEALARWNHPELGPVPPGEFVPLAIAYGLAPLLDAWALSRAVADTPRVRAALGPRTRVAVNVTTTSITDGSLLRQVRELRVPPGALQLELTEHVLVQQPERAREVLRALAGLGVETAVDDFGTGYSSLAALTQLPVQALKIDRAFVAGIAHDRDAVAVVTSVVALARALRLRTVAEGVETPQQVQVLRRLGVDEGQGWLWSRAVAPDQLEGIALGSTAPASPRTSGARSSWFSPVEVDDGHGISLMRRLAEEGVSCTSVAAALNNAGYRTPLGTRWHRATVERVLREAPPAA